VADRPERALWHPAAALPLLLIIGPYYINKLIYVAYPGNYPVFLAADYTLKLLTLTVLGLVLRGAPVRFAIRWRFSGARLEDWVFVAAGTLTLVVLDVLTYSGKQWLNDVTGHLTRYPSATGHPHLAIIDATFGCLLTGVAEETIFRFYIINVLVLRGLSLRAAIAVSIPVFAAIHWSYGGGNVAYAALAGLVLALSYRATRNLFAPAVIHTLVDSYYFSHADETVRGWIW